MLLLSGLMAVFLIFSIWYAYEWIKFIEEYYNNNSK